MIIVTIITHITSLFCKLLPHQNGSRVCSEVAATKDTLEGEATSINVPVLCSDVPVTNIPAHQVKDDSLALPSAQPNLVEAAELARRCALWCGLKEWAYNCGIAKLFTEPVLATWASIVITVSQRAGFPPGWTGCCAGKAVRLLGWLALATSLVRLKVV